LKILATARICVQGSFLDKDSLENADYTSCLGMSLVICLGKPVCLKGLMSGFKCCSLYSSNVKWCSWMETAVPLRVGRFIFTRIHAASFFML